MRSDTKFDGPVFRPSPTFTLELVSDLPLTSLEIAIALRRIADRIERDGMTQNEVHRHSTRVHDILVGGAFEQKVG